ncbi:L,D-transpeptidase scaffold domain-containing protein [Mucilaginibacter auburnensis]|uniref:L,D-transpeptidase-like protein n=1 Tax=Mucilaginibacter auburnensis TaxID=1457233 RepID=A0A2H9VRT7_9SPHI|nr:L,D-transpeptidase family protein [Mucilaginibacter auburnensis]PJJ83533.1 L,D-transpeptidase-like protein [Mucilaginibacter auburnensis]
MRKLCLILSFLFAFGAMSCRAQVSADAALATEIQAQLDDINLAAQLNFPASVARFYREGKFAGTWVTDNYGQNAKWQALLLIDCVLQYGLSPADYHPKEILYNRLYDIEKTDKLNVAQKARFDIMMTDAMVTLLNYLHYGKLNPNYGQLAIDKGLGLPFNAERSLALILKQPDFKTGMLDVQPRSKAYADLQYKMRQLKGQYDGDCYTVPEQTIRKIAINMERLRWAEINDAEAYVHVNIPSFDLTYHLPDTNRMFKVIVGSPEHPTPVLQSNIEYFTTAPEWKIPASIFNKELLPKAIKNPAYLTENNLTIYDGVGQVENIDAALLNTIAKNSKNYYAKQAAGCDNALGLLVFRFKNIYSVYLHDTPDKMLFKREKRDLSHGCIRVENAALLAELLLKNDAQGGKVAQLKRNLTKEKQQNFVLTQPVPVKLTYLTCLVKDGEIVNYKDIYTLDKSLEMAMYGVSDPVNLR